MDSEVVECRKFGASSFTRAVMRLRLGRVGLTVLLTWKVLFFEQDCQTGQDSKCAIASYCVIDPVFQFGCGR